MKVCDGSVASYIVINKVISSGCHELHCAHMEDKLAIDYLVLP